jgi:uncharacterized protein
VPKKSEDYTLCNQGRENVGSPNHKFAVAYALNRLDELTPNHFYHSLAHTRDIVVPAVERLSAMEGVTGIDLTLVKTAAFFHDIGFVRQYQDHEAVSVQIAMEVLPGFGYNSSQVRIVSGIIIATRLPQTPKTHLEEIMADADMDILGREDFWDFNQSLHAELAAFGFPLANLAWYRSQLEFMQNHQYFTKSALALRGRGKQQNLDKLKMKIKKETQLL